QLCEERLSNITAALRQSEKRPRSGQAKAYVDRLTMPPVETGNVRRLIGSQDMTTLRTKLARAIATAGGAGYSPFAPGTCGTLVAVPLAWALAPLSLWTYFTVCVAVT